MEYFNDFAFIDLLVHLKSKIECTHQKKLISDFLAKSGVSIFWEYLREYRYNIETGEYDPNSDLKIIGQIKKLRKREIKQEANGKHYMKISDVMGLNNESDDFNITLYIDEKDRLTGTNFKYFEVADDFTTYDRTLANIRSQFVHEIGQNNVSSLRENFYTFFLDDREHLIGSEQYKEYSYQSKKLFKNITRINDQKIILLYYGDLKAIATLNKYLDEFIFKYKGYTFSYKRFIRKQIALLIEGIWDDAKKYDEGFFKDFLIEFESNVEKDFFVNNRKIRNNIHYNSTTFLNEKELEELDEFQGKYVGSLIEIIEENIYIEIGELELFYTWVSRYMEEKDINIETINHQRNELFLRFKKEKENRL